MNGWETKIIDAFTGRYFASAAETAGERKTMRLRSLSIFPDFDAALPDEKESYLEAAESLERKGLLTLNWEKRSKGERLKTLTCADMGKLFEESGGKDPKAAAAEIRSLFAARAPGNPFLNYLAEHFGPAEIGRGMDLKAAEDFIRLIELFLSPAGPANFTTRALSISLYSDSKRLEHLLDLFGPLLSRVKKEGIPAPGSSPSDLSFPERSFPETMIAGKLIFEYDDNENGSVPPLVNAGGLILGFPLRSVRIIRNIKTIDSKERPSVLTIENKETFYALSDTPEGPREGPPELPQSGAAGVSHMDAFLYVGGYLNQAAAGMIKTLADSGFRVYHAGDLDPDGILILQNIMDITGKPVAPVGMNAAVFDRYLPWARPLAGTMLSQLKKVREDTKAIPGLADLMRRIEETGRGVEQEIIDYRGGELSTK
jgi:hypothetical protein